MTRESFFPDPNPLRRYVATPQELEGEYQRLEPSSEDIEGADIDPELIEEAASQQNELTEIENELSSQQVADIHAEIHKDHTAQLRTSTTIGMDMDHLDDSLKPAREEKHDAVQKNRSMTAKTPLTGLLEDIEKLSPSEKELFANAKDVRELLELLSGRALIPLRFGKQLRNADTKKRDE